MLQNADKGSACASADGRGTSFPTPLLIYCEAYIGKKTATPPQFHRYCQSVDLERSSQLHVLAITQMGFKHTIAEHFVFRRVDSQRAPSC